LFVVIGHGHLEESECRPPHYPGGLLSRNPGDIRQPYERLDAARRSDRQDEALKGGRGELVRSWAVNRS